MLGSISVNTSDTLGIIFRFDTAKFVECLLMYDSNISLQRDI